MPVPIGDEANAYITKANHPAESCAIRLVKGRYVMVTRIFRFCVAEQFKKSTISKKSSLGWGLAAFCKGDHLHENDLSPIASCVNFYSFTDKL